MYTNIESRKSDNMRKRGFTLIELLATIVILAIIALIATPIVMNVIENYKKGVAEQSAKNLEHIAQVYYYDNKIKAGFNDIKFICNGENCSNGDKVLSINGKVPESGNISITKDGIVTLNSIVIKGYTCYKQNESYTCEKGKKTTVNSTDSVLTINDSKSTSLANYRIYGNNISDDVFVENLPSEYQQVEYLESTGTQYIDTGVQPNNNTKVEVIFELTESGLNSSQYVVGSRETKNSTIIFGMGGSSSNLYFINYFF